MSIRVSARQTPAQQPEAAFAIRTKCIKIFRTVRQRQRLGLAVERHPSQRESLLGEAADKDRVAQNGQSRRRQERRGQRKRLIFIVKFAASGFNWCGGGSAVQCCSGLRVRQGDGRHLARRGTAAEQREQQKNGKEGPEFVHKYLQSESLERGALYAHTARRLVVCVCLLGREPPFYDRLLQSSTMRLPQSSGKVKRS